MIFYILHKQQRRYSTCWLGFMGITGSLARHPGSTRLLSNCKQSLLVDLNLPSQQPRSQCSEILFKYFLRKNGILYKRNQFLHSGDLSSSFRIPLGYGLNFQLLLRLHSIYNCLILILESKKSIKISYSFYNHTLVIYLFISVFTYLLLFFSMNIIFMQNLLT